MPKTPSSRPVKKPVAKKAVKKSAARKTAAKTSVSTKATPKKTAPRPRAKVLNEHPANLAVDPHDHAAIEAIKEAGAKRARPERKRTLNATDNAANPPPDEGGAASMITRVSDAIERELSKIERIVGNPLRMRPAQRIETESRARVLASLARTLKEVMHLRSETGGADDTAKAADDDAVPRDLDEFRRELSRRLEGMVEGRAEIPAAGDESG